MNYKKLMYLITLSSHIFNFTGGVASRALSNPAPKKTFEEMSPAEKLEHVQKCADNRIAQEIEGKGVPLSEVPKKLKNLLNFPLYKKLYSVTAYGIRFEKCLLKGNDHMPDTITWVQISQISGQRRDRSR